jgi:hypothetical protein
MANNELLAFQVKFCVRLNRLSLEPEPRLKTSELEPKAPKASSSRAYGQHY